MAFRVVDRASRDLLGEGPVWNATRRELLWVDILAPCVRRLALDTGIVRTLETTENIGWVLPCVDGTDHVVGFASGFYFLDIDTGERRLIGAPEPDRTGNRLNDGKVDRQGRIWAGSMEMAQTGSFGALYRLDPDLSWQRLDDNYGVANGPTFSVDGRTLYHTDSAARTIYAFDLCDDGSLRNKRIWLTFDQEWGFPDGMTTDAEGCLWIAHWAGARVSRFDADARLVESIALPARNITSCAFAGDALDRLFVTSAAIESDAGPYDGALFEIEAGVTGLPQPRFGALP